MFAWFTRRKPEPRIVEAVMTAVAHRDHTRAHAVEAAMSQAVMEFLRDGGSIDDAVALRAVQMDARARVLRRTN